MTNFHVRKKINTRETNTERKKRLSFDRGRARVTSPTVPELGAAVDTFADNILECAGHLQRVAALQSVTLTTEHAGDIIAAALERRPLLWTTLGASRPSQIILESILENADPRSLICPEFTDIRVALDEDDARAIWRDVDHEAIRRLWRDNRLPKHYKPKNAQPRLDVQPERNYPHV